MQRSDHTKCEITDHNIGEETTSLDGENHILLDKIPEQDLHNLPFVKVCPLHTDL